MLLSTLSSHARQYGGSGLRAYGAKEAERPNPPQEHFNQLSAFTTAAPECAVRCAGMSALK